MDFQNLKTHWKLLKWWKSLKYNLIFKKAGKSGKSRTNSIPDHHTWKNNNNKNSSFSPSLWGVILDFFQKSGHVIYPLLCLAFMHKMKKGNEQNSRNWQKCTFLAYFDLFFAIFGQKRFFLEKRCTPYDYTYISKDAYIK